MDSISPKLTLSYASNFDRLLWMELILWAWEVYKRKNADWIIGQHSVMRQKKVIKVLMSRIKCALNQAKTSLFSRLQLECIKFYQSLSTTAECWTSQTNQFILDALLNNNLVLVTPSGSEHINISLQQRYSSTLDLLQIIRKPLLSTWISSGQRLLSLEVPNALPISHHIRLLLIFLYYLSKKLRLNQAIN